MAQHRKAMAATIFQFMCPAILYTIDVDMWLEYMKFSLFINKIIGGWYVQIVYMYKGHL